jgi:hypothetical protein
MTPEAALHWLHNWMAGGKTANGWVFPHGTKEAKKVIVEALKQSDAMSDGSGKK